FGAQSDRRLGIPGEDLSGSWSATEFVAWYNGHPDYQELLFDLNVDRAVVIGNGNVALDVARMLALTPEELSPTDTTDPAIDAIGASTVSEIVHNRLEEKDGRLVATAADERETIECGLVFRSVGYRGVGLPELPFDEQRGTIRNDRGRVLGDKGEPVAQVYCAGWIKRGPTGVIGTNKKDAAETVALLLEDAEAGRLVHRAEATAEAVDSLLAERRIPAVLHAGWTSIDE